MHSWRSPLTLFGGLSVATYDVDITVISREIDFDDGKCPIYHNHMKGIYNAPVSQAPVLMLCPRAWNMVEHNMMVPGPLFDFGLLMFHNAKLILQNQSGPFFYLSKVSSYIEARLWSQISFWTEKKLGLQVGCMKATVLIECVPASFEMEILYELKEHSAGLNCGIWDYSASFVNRFGHQADFLLPDHSKYVDMEKRFLHSYMDLLVQTCHRRGALATGGMAALLLPGDKETQRKQAGVDGFMVYDMDLIEPMQKLFQLHSHGQNQLLQLREDITVTPEDLLIMPAGGVTRYGLRYNIAVGVLFIEAWLSGRGHFFYLGKVGSLRVWQWIRYQVRLEDDRAVDPSSCQITDLFSISTLFRDKQRLMTAVSMFLETVLKNDFPEFLTTYLNLDHTFHSSQS
uniref:malate synthase n=1 Tax=Cyprinus carpio TaxID=7962 RepID=A0A8C1J385_CYPCA